MQSKEDQANLLCSHCQAQSDELMKHSCIWVWLLTDTEQVIKGIHTSHRPVDYVRVKMSSSTLGPHPPLHSMIHTYNEALLLRDSHSHSLSLWAYWRTASLSHTYNCRQSYVKLKHVFGPLIILIWGYSFSFHPVWGVTISISDNYSWDFATSAKCMH